MGRAIEGVKGREWEERLRRYADSQLTMDELYDWEGVSVAAFYVWRKKLAGSHPRRPANTDLPTAEVAPRPEGSLAGSPSSRFV